jgi:ectoine hydroxylase-related dioxygenase (phytanoyl-CoA dioxygenase family)
MTWNQYKTQVEANGFSIIDAIYTDTEVANIISAIENTEARSETFRKSAELFAIRQFLKEIAGVLPLLLNSKLRQIIGTLFGSDYFVVKSIYFDKSKTSNWYVAYHQDLPISVNEKADIQNFGPWTVKQNQFAVQPPLQILESIYTIRIHLDETNQDNGALKVIQRSHSKKIYRPETINWNIETEAVCNVTKGGIMIMKPLLLHSSGRTINNKRRRVIHIEFSSDKLPEPLQWAEKLYLN